MSEQKQKNYQTEWSFDMSKLADRVTDFAKSVGTRAEEEVRHERFVAALNGAQSATADLHLSVGKTVIHAISGENLIEADLTYVGDIRFEVAGDAEKTVHLSQEAGGAGFFRNVFGWVGSGQKLNWDIGLSRHVPMDLRIRGGVGKTDMNLQELDVTALRFSSGTGEVSAILPAPDRNYEARIDCGVGKVDIVVPHSADLRLDVNGGTGEFNLEIGENVDLNLNVSAGVGAVNIRLPQGAAVRLAGKRGIGSIRVPDTMARVGAGDVWQSVNYETAERRITIHYQGGIGTLHVK